MSDSATTVKSIGLTCSIKHDDNVISLSCVLRVIRDVLSLEWIDDVEIDIVKGKITEEICFDFLSGDSYIRLLQNGNCICEKILLSQFMIGVHEPIYKLANNKNNIKRLAESFEQVQGKLPFSIDEMELNNFILLTKFIGYKRDFYDGIPYSETEQHKYIGYKRDFYHGIPYSETEKHKCIVDESFNDISKKLHFAKDIPELYQNSSLPKIKSVKKVVFNTPELLFYLYEIERLWGIIKDPNYFCKLLNFCDTYELLSYFHLYKNTLDYLDMISKYSTTKQLTNMFFVNDIYCFRHAAEKFCAMSDYEKKKFEMGLKYGHENIYREFSKPVISARFTEIPNCEIGGYQFKWLKSTKECHDVGKELHNCLTIYNASSNAVTVMINKEGVYVVAIELCGKKIIQAYGNHNSNIHTNKNIYNAFMEWVEKFSLDYKPKKE